MTLLYGIKNCDTVRKARRWLDQRGVDYRFHDFRQDGLEEATLRRWCAELGWERVLNRRGRSFRQLSPAQVEGLDEARAIPLMLAEPTLIKRPVLEHGEQLRIGFDEPAYAELLPTP